MSTSAIYTLYISHTYHICNNIIILIKRRLTHNLLWMWILNKRPEYPHNIKIKLPKPQNSSIFSLPILDMVSFLCAYSASAYTYTVYTHIACDMWCLFTVRIIMVYTSTVHSTIMYVISGVIWAVGAWPSKKLQIGENDPPKKARYQKKISNNVLGCQSQSKQYTVGKTSLVKQNKIK